MGKRVDASHCATLRDAQRALHVRCMRVSRAAACYNCSQSGTSPRPPSSAARFPSGGQQVDTQLPGALLTISSTGPASQANGSTPVITIGGYASSANLLRSNILVCKAVIHVVDSVLLVS